MSGAVVVTALVAAALSGCATSAAGSCAGTTIDLGESTLEPGGVVRLSVDHMWQTCEDTGGTSRPADDVTVTITPESTGKDVLIGRPEPSGDLDTVRGAFDLPEDLPTGAATLSVQSHGGDQAGAELPVTIGAVGRR